MIRETSETAAKQIEKIKSNPWKIANMDVDPAVWQDASLKKLVIKQLLSFIEQEFDEAVFLYMSLRQKNCPWPELDVISKHIHENLLNASILSFLLSAARDQIKDRWPEAEEFFAVDPKYAALYAKQILKDRFVAGEPVIMKDPYWANTYKEWFAIKESQISKSIPGNVGVHILHEFQRDIYRGIASLISAGYTIRDFPKGIEIIERNKKAIIRDLLNLLLNRATTMRRDTDLNSVVYRVTLLQKHADVKWPELDVISSYIDPLKNSLMESQYQVVNHRVYGKVLGQNNRVIITDYDTADDLASQYKGSSLLKIRQGRYMIKLSEVS